MGEFDYSARTTLDPGANRVTGICGRGWFSGGHLSSDPGHPGHPLLFPRRVFLLPLGMDFGNSMGCLGWNIWQHVQDGEFSTAARHSEDEDRLLF